MLESALCILNSQSKMQWVLRNRRNSEAFIGKTIARAKRQSLHSFLTSSQIAAVLIQL